MTDPTFAAGQQHSIEIGLSPWHEGMVSWTCACGEARPTSFIDVGRASNDALDHVPVGESWQISPHPELITERADR